MADVLDDLRDCCVACRGYGVDAGGSGSAPDMMLESDIGSAVLVGVCIYVTVRLEAYQQLLKNVLQLWRAVGCSFAAEPEPRPDSTVDTWAARQESETWYPSS